MPIAERLRTEGLMRSSGRLGQVGSVDRCGAMSGSDIARGSSSSVVSCSLSASSSSTRASGGGLEEFEAKIGVLAGHA